MEAYNRLEDGRELATIRANAPPSPAETPPAPPPGFRAAAAPPGGWGGIVSGFAKSLIGR